jgi:hypothetical protein
MSPPTQDSQPPRGTMQRLLDHFAGRDALREAGKDAPDPAELWGRRIGRALSLIGVLVLAALLVYQLRR